MREWAKAAEPRRAASLRECDLVAYAYRAFRQNLSPQSSAVQQALDHRLTRHFLQVSAGLAQADASNAYIADGELFAHQMVQRDVARHDVAARFAGSKLDLIVPLQGFNRLRLNQREFEIRLGLVERAQLQRVAITVKARARNRRRVGNRLRWSFGSGGDMNRFHRSVRHSAPPTT